MLTLGDHKATESGDEVAKWYFEPGPLAKLTNGSGRSPTKTLVIPCAPKALGVVGDGRRAGGPCFLRGPLN